MPNEEKTQTEIVIATPQEVQVLGESCQLRFVSVHYNIAVVMRKVGNTLAGERVEADHVFGRAMGERSDGKTFFSSVVLPWMWEPGYDWMTNARSRLDSFLEKECQCDARTEETKVCDFHHALISVWEDQDRLEMEITRREYLRLSGSREGGGVFPDTVSMHKDYPWCRETKDGRYMCTICGFGKEPQEAFHNPTYRNIFIRDHSHCGFKNPKYYEPPLPVDLKRLEQVTQEALDPSTPIPCHAPGCPCHQCRIAAENQAKTIDAEDL